MAGLYRSNGPTLPVVPGPDDSATPPMDVDSLTALATLLGLDQPTDIPSPHAGPSAEFVAPEYKYSGTVPSRAEQSTPFELEQTARANAATAKDRARVDKMQALSDFFLPDAERQRDEELNSKLTVAMAPGQAQRDVARITAQGGIDKQRVANEGAISAAEAKANAAGAGGGKLSPGLAERVAGAQTALGTIHELKQLYPKVQGFFTGIGPASGRFSEFMQGTPLTDANTDFGAFSTRSATLANSVIKAITGAQMSEPEAVRLMKQIPTTHDKPALWTQKADALEQNLNDTITNIHNVNRGGGMPVTPERLQELAQQLGLSIDGNGGDAGAPDDLNAWGVEVQ
jgi:hypothetical protein